MLIPLQISRFSTKKVEITMINADIYYAVCKLIKAQIFAVSMRDLEYQIEKKVKPETDLRIFILEKYYNLLDVFFKKSFNMLPPY